MHYLQFLILAIFPVLTTAQTHQLGLNYGPLYYNTSSSDFMTFPSLKGIGHSSALTLRSSWKHVELGVGMEIGGLQGEDAPYYSVDNAGSMLSIGTIYYNIARTYYQPQIFANYRLALHRFHIYGGVLGGFLVAEGKSKMYINMYQPGIEVSDFIAWGFSLGLQAGAGYSLSKHFSLNAELAARRSSLHEKKKFLSFSANNVKTTLNSYQVMLGVRYLLSIHRE